MLMNWFRWTVDECNAVYNPPNATPLVSNPAMLEPCLLSHPSRLVANHVHIVTMSPRLEIQSAEWLSIVDLQVLERVAGPLDFGSLSDTESDGSLNLSWVKLKAMYRYCHGWLHQLVDISQPRSYLSNCFPGQA